MAARVQVVIEAKDATGGVFRAITSELGAFGGLMEELTAKNVSWGNVGQMAASMVVDGMKAAINTTMQYAQEVRDLSLASGQSAEESSRMLQVLDDYQLTADDAKTATRALTREGLAPTIDTIANLSAQFQQLTSVEERNAFVQKNLGRAGQEWLNLLSQGPDKIRAMNDAVSENLILTDENIRATEEYRLAMDEWGDSVEGLQIQLGTKAIPVLTDMVSWTLKASEAASENVAWYERLIPAVGAVHDAINFFRISQEDNTEATEAATAAAQQQEATMLELEAAEKAAAEAAKAMTEENKSFLATVTSVASALDSYREGQAAVIAEYQKGSITADEYGLKMEALGEKHQAVMNNMILDLYRMQLTADGAFDDADITKYLTAAERFGVITAEDRRRALELYKEVDNLNASLGEVAGPMLHVSERAEDAAENFGAMTEAGADLGESLRKEVASGAAAATAALNSIPTQIDVFINVHTRGSIPNFATAGGAGGSQNIAEAKQAGGEVFAGMPTWVGEAGRERFIPSQNGRILGHAESLHAATVGGGMSGTNYFYGPVTISPDSGAGGDIMSIR